MRFLTQAVASSVPANRNKISNMNEDSRPNQEAVQVVLGQVAPSVRFRRFVLYLVILVAGLSLDLWTKSWMFECLGNTGDIWWIIDDVFGFQTSLNQGALFGMGQGKVHLFALFSFVAIGGILVWLFFFRGLSNLFLTVVLGMLSAGILGNLYDRLGLHGLKWDDGTAVYAVRDWILVMIGHWPWPNFNIADSLLVCGAILLALFAFFSKEEVF